ncbi:MAG: AsnC family transcriptional regulator [Deltaproteobacteria bacterium]|nr:AsnC family transcriptional regulator [Deltaproteobacteria bacterium]
MDAIDKKLLNALQEDFPCVTRPYLHIAEQLGLTEAEVLERVHNLKATGIIRRMGAVFSGEALGFVGRLCAMKVATNDIERVAAVINAYPNVTHNYLRSHEYNLWFTVSAEDEEELQRVLENIQRTTGIAALISLRSKQVFKLDARFAV